MQNTRKSYFLLIFSFSRRAKHNMCSQGKSQHIHPEVHICQFMSSLLGERYVTVLIESREKKDRESRTKVCRYICDTCSCYFRKLPFSLFHKNESCQFVGFLTKMSKFQKKLSNFHKICHFADYSRKFSNFL